MLTIKPFAETDSAYEAIVEIWNAYWPDRPQTVERRKNGDAWRNPDYQFQRYVVTMNESDNSQVDQQIVAFGGYDEYWLRTREVGRYFIEFYVHPDFAHVEVDSKNLETVLYEYLLDVLAKFEPAKIVTESRSDKLERLQFLKRCGFKETLHSTMSYLSLSDFRPAVLGQTDSRMAALGIQIVSYAKLNTRIPAWKRKLWDLMWSIQQDLPRSAPLVRQPFPQFEQSLDDSFPLSSKSSFVAVQQDRLVGLSVLRPVEAAPGLMHTGLTGVLRTHRRQGVATALKLRVIASAIEYGAHTIETDNEENGPMYQLNMKLGFKPGPALLELQKIITNMAHL
ncbi:GNAT family N-acetyltransferase [Chloroflexi bacterium TSY]|nr:GNAT family N-acetyltransferase [Chloroflexi bacterium TSY]